MAMRATSYRRLLSAYKPSKTLRSFSLSSGQTLFHNAKYSTVFQPIRATTSSNYNFCFNEKTRYYSSNSLTTVEVPAMGDSISEGTVVEWVKGQGDYVQVDDIIVVLETDKVSVDVRAPAAGVISEVLADIDQVVLIGAPLVKIDTSAAKEASASSSSSTSSTSSSSTSSSTSKSNETSELSTSSQSSSADVITVGVPSMGDSISEGTVVEWAKVSGDYVQVDDIIVTLETDKVSVDVRAPEAGLITETMVELDQTVTIGAPLFKLDPSAASKNSNDETSSSSSSSSTSSSSSSTSSSSSSEKTSSSSSSSSSSEKSSKSSEKSSKSSSSTEYTEQGGANRKERRVKMNQMRSRIAQRLKDAQNTAAMLTTFQEVDMGNLMELRSEFKDAFQEEYGVKLGFMSAFVAAASKALFEVPAVNASIDNDTNEIIYHDFVDISVAVASEKGLVVPVLRNCEKMSFADIEKSIAELGVKARNGTLSLEEMAGGTFTISNGGVWGSLLSTPILNPPQSAVLGMHGIKLRPMEYKGSIVARPMMYLALTYDHRIIDGREGVTFLKSITNKIEDPRRLLLGIR